LYMQTVKKIEKRAGIQGGEEKNRGKDLETTTGQPQHNLLALRKATWGTDRQEMWKKRACTTTGPCLQSPRHTRSPTAVTVTMPQNTEREGERKTETEERRVEKRIKAGKNTIKQKKH